MKEQKEKYESPFMERTFVELESGFCAASVAEYTKSGSVKTTGHELNEIDVTNESWNSIDNTGQNGWE